MRKATAFAALAATILTVVPASCQNLHMVPTGEVRRTDARKYEMARTVVTVDITVHR